MASRVISLLDTNAISDLMSLTRSGVS
jgi:hypothetical protein